ncbi:hypothetical protein [Saccharothrix sp. NRRL B-16314]|uniref:hypothetical protein n=1 Tax=Saccharothrix sp. NRRL B-16314 TaxID=1463825 RepID=UPI00052481B0|nr:hypothetical protein [Saccharothrix sp. NRRL B-16314]
MNGRDHRLRLDELLVAVTNVKVTGDIELSREEESKAARKAGGSATASLKPTPAFEAKLSAEPSTEGRDLLRETRRGTERLSLDFSDVTRARSAIDRQRHLRREAHAV